MPVHEFQQFQQSDPWSKRCSAYHDERKNIDGSPLSILKTRSFHLTFTICQNVFGPFVVGYKIHSKVELSQQNETFAEFNDFKRKIDNCAFFVEEKPGFFVECKEFRVRAKSFFVQVRTHQTRKVINDIKCAKMYCG